MSTALWQYRFKSEHREECLKEIQEYEWALIFSWASALLLWGLLWWAAFRLLCNMVQLVRYVPGLLR